jgi:hypothetical protein
MITLNKKEKECCLFLFDIACNNSHGNVSFFSHLYNTFYILKINNFPEHVCLAGLYHAVYGTEFYHLAIFEDREKIKNIIGNEAEELVFLFGKTDIRSKLLNNNSLDKEKIFFLTAIEYANLIEQSNYIRDNVEESYLKKLENILNNNGV